jgi:tetratricopeptide (TPR) repeat protein
MLDGALGAGTTDFAIAVDRKSTPGTARWVRWHLFRRRGLLASVLRPARVVEFTWCDDFAHARNVALDLVPRDCDWWLAIDADDRFECLGPQRLPDYLATLASDVKIVSVPYICADRDGRLTDTMSYETIFRGPITYRWERAWGETLEPIDRQRAARNAPFRRVHDQDRSISRIRTRNQKAMQRALDQRPGDPELWSFKSLNHTLRWELDAAIESAGKAIALESNPRRRYGFMLGAMRPLLLAARASEVLDLALVAESIEPQYPEAYILEGRARFILGDFTGAIAATTQGLSRMAAVARIDQRQHVGSTGNPIQLYECEPFLVLAEAHGQLEQFELALASVERALAARPPVHFEHHLSTLRQQLSAGERPPFLGGATFTEVMTNTHAVIQRIREYPSVHALLKDLDNEESGLYAALVSTAVDREFVAQFAENYFAGESWPLAETTNMTPRGAE